MKRISSDPSFEFEKYLSLTLEFECGPDDKGSFQKNDPGGFTRFGLSSRSYPDLSLANLTFAQAKLIYKSDFWEKARCRELPDRMAGYFLDTIVNCGITAGTKLLQRAINDQNKTKVNNVIIEIDGIIGPITLHHSKNLDLSRLRYWRVKHYFDLVQKKPVLAVFLYGWYRRAVEYG